MGFFLVFKIKALAFLLLLLTNLSHADELWMHELSGSRFYLSVEKTDEGPVLRKFLQNKGEHQSLVSTFNFKNVSTLKKFVSIRFPEYRSVKSLPSWPIKTSFDMNVDKGFGRAKNQYLWVAKNQWSDEWEEKYGIWLATIKPDFFKKYKIQTDCADAVIGLRWIFSRMNSLPAVNNMADTGSLFGHYSMLKEWRKYDTAENWYEDELFLAALNYVMDMTSTRTIDNDGFPVSIDEKGLIPGVYIVTQNNGSGHAKVITETHYDEVTELPLYTLASTSPREVRILTKEVFLDQDWPEKGNKEILAFRWPVVKNNTWVLQAKEERAAYSLEQFDTNLKSDYPAFIELVLARVKGDYDPLKLVQLGVQDILAYASQRIEVVIKGYEYCRKNNCAPGSAGDDDWGTPSRDAKLLKKFHDIDTLVKEFENLSPGLYDRWISGLRAATIEVEGVSLKLSSLRFIMENNLYSSLGSDTTARRWGLNTSELLPKWMANVEKLLNEREAVIARPENPCREKECYPKTNLWVGLSTYPIDAELNSVYTLITTYCSMIDVKGCKTYFAVKGQKPLFYSGQTRSIESWFNKIPFFHSDARVSVERRWGEIPADLKALVLPYFDTIKVSKNSLALLDSTKLMNLKTEKILYEADNETRIVLTKAGVVYKINDVVGSIKRMLLGENQISWIDVADNDMLLNLEKERPLYISEDRGYTIFRKPLAQSTITFRLKNDVIEFIKEHSGATHQYGPLVTMALDKNTMSFIDLDRTLDVSIVIPSSESFFDMNQVQISSYKYPKVVLKYSDRDQNLYYPVVVDLEKKTWIRVAPELTENSIVLWSDASLNKALIQTGYNSEFPTVYAVSWDDQRKFKSQKLSNLITGAEAVDDLVYFISAAGGVWDQNPKTKLFKWDTSLHELEVPKNFEVKFLNSEGIYYTSEEKGFLRTFRNTKDLNLPKDLLAEDEFCQIQSKSKDIFSYRFSSSYGDHLCMGGSLLKSQISVSNSDLIPQFSTYSWINKESLLDLRWQKSFMDFEIENGQLVSLGKNLGLWFAEAANREK